MLPETYKYSYYTKRELFQGKVKNLVIVTVTVTSYKVF